MELVCVARYHLWRRPPLLYIPYFRLQVLPQGRKCTDFIGQSQNNGIFCWHLPVNIIGETRIHGMSVGAIASAAKTWLAQRDGYALLSSF